MNWHSEAVRLRELGMPLAVLAEHWQVTLSQARRYCDPRAMAFSDMAQMEPHPLTYETGRFAYGPLLAAWLRPRHPDLSTRSHGRAYREVLSWAHGRRPSFASVDRILTDLGECVTHAPQHIWVSHSHGATAWHERVLRIEQLRQRRAAA